MSASLNNSILECLAFHAQHRPDKLCMADKANAFTYRELFEYARSFSEYLKQRYHVNKSDYVVVVNSQTIEFFIIEMSVHLAGAIFVPVEKNVGAERVMEIVEAIGAKLFISQKDYGLDIDRIQMADIIGICASTGYDQPEDVTFPNPEEVSEILFTTGTTGKSKGIVLPHRSALAIAQNITRATEIKPDNVEIITVPLNHAYGLRRMYSSVLNGSTFVICDGILLMKQMFDLMRQYRVTSVALVPAAVNALLKLARPELAEFRQQMDFILVSSSSYREKDKTEFLKCFPNSRHYNSYGCTEAGCACTMDHNKDGLNPLSIGYPTVNTEIVFVDENRNIIKNPTAENPGVIAIKGGATMYGYFNDPELTAATISGGYVYTNDLGYLETGGEITLLGRRDDVINSGGQKIAPSEIEEIVLLEDSVEDCACTGIADNMLGQVPKLYVVIKQGMPFDPKAIEDFLDQKLEKFKVPRYIEELNAIPRTYNGKIRRNML